MTPQTPSPPTVLQPEHLALGRVYAEALADVTGDQGKEINEELIALAEVLRHIDGAVEMLSSPHLPAADRASMVERIFGGRVSEPVASLLGVMARNGRLGLLPAVAQAFGGVLDERAGRVEAFVTTAVPLADDQKDAIRRQVAEMIGAKPVLRCQIDQNILGGMVLKIGDRVYDASVAGDLKQLTENVARSLAESRMRRTNDSSPSGGGDESSSRKSDEDKEI